MTYPFRLFQSKNKLFVPTEYTLCFPPFSCAFPPTVPSYVAIVAPLPASSMTQVGSGGLRSWVWIGGPVDSVEAG